MCHALVRVSRRGGGLVARLIHGGQVHEYRVGWHDDPTRVARRLVQAVFGGRWECSRSERTWYWLRPAV